MKDKKKKKRIIISCFGAFLFIVIFINIVRVFLPEERDMSRVKKGENFIDSLQCTYTDKDDFQYTIDLSFQENILLEKREEMTWEEKEQPTCTFYKKRVEVFNSIEGIQDQIECDATTGKRITIYTFEDLDTKEANIAELRYIRDDKSFDIDSYISYRKSKGYRCQKN